MNNVERCLLIGIALLLSTGCASRRVAAMKQNLEPEAEREFLRTRVTQLWQAKVVEDWDSAFDFYEPEKRTAYRATGIAEYGTEPVRILSFNVENVVTENDLGWVLVAYQVTLLRYDYPVPVAMQSSEKWRRVDGNWYFVPGRESIMYPESPELRNRSEEAVLRKRFEESWSARRRSKWDRLYKMIDPRDHEQVILDDYAHTEDEFRYLQCRVGWVEVIGDSGRVLVTYNRQSTDKNFSELPPSDATTIEQWVRIKGVWYLDVK